MSATLAGQKVNRFLSTIRHRKFLLQDQSTILSYPVLLTYRLLSRNNYLGALVVTHAMLRRLTSWRCVIIICVVTPVKGAVQRKTFMV